MMTQNKYSNTYDYSADEIRAFLDHVTGDEGRLVDERLREIEAVAKRMGRHIRVINRECIGRESPRMRCIVVCFGLQKYFPEIEKRRTCPDDTFIQFMRENAVLVMKDSLATARDGDHVVYYARNSEFSAQHAGVWHSGLIISKWGALSTIEHGVWDVPSSYGDHIRVFAHINESYAWNMYEQWLKTRMDADWRPYAK